MQLVIDFLHLDTPYFMSMNNNNKLSLGKLLHSFFHNYYEMYCILLRNIFVVLIPKINSYLVNNKFYSKSNLYFGKGKNFDTFSLVDKDISP